MHDTNTITPVRNDSDASQAFILANISLMVFIMGAKSYLFSLSHSVIVAVSEGRITLG